MTTDVAQGTPTLPADPSGLTGAFVRSVRELYKLSRRDFTALAGFAAQARIGNIEHHDSWKEGDREVVWRTLTQLLTSPPPPDGASKPRTTKRALSTEDVITFNREHRAAQAGKLQPLPKPREADGELSPRGEETFRRVMEQLNELFYPENVDIDAIPADIDVIIWNPEHLATVIVDRKPTLADLPPVDHTFSNGEFAAWDRCPRKWWLAWYRKLAARGSDPGGPRAIGDRVHRALAWWYVPDVNERVDPRDALERIIVDDWTAIVNGVRDEWGEHADERLVTLADSFNAATTLERIMIEGYVQWLEDTGADAEYDIIGAEQVMHADVDLKMDPQSDDEQRKIRIIGRLDSRIRRRSDGVRLFDDHKTVQSLAGPLKTLHGDPQMLTYHVLEWLNTPEGESRCDGALYNMLRKVKRTATATPPFYDRAEIHHSTVELENHLRELMTKAREILRAEDALNRGVDPHDVVTRRWREDCSWSCDFFPICPMFDDGSHVENAIEGLYREVDPRSRYDRLEVETA